MGLKFLKKKKTLIREKNPNWGQNPTNTPKMQFSFLIPIREDYAMAGPKVSFTDLSTLYVSVQ